MPPVKTPQKAKISLDDLSAVDRARLAKELAAQDDATTEEHVERAARRRAQLAELLDDRDHLRDCPGGRVEAYANVKPARPQAGEPAQPVTVVRCIECGGSTVLDRSFADVMADVESEDN